MEQMSEETARALLYEMQLLGRGLSFMSGYFRNGYEGKAITARTDTPFPPSPVPPHAGVDAYWESKGLGRVKEQ